MEEVNDARLFKETDIFLVPLCLMVLYAIAYIAKKKYRNTGIERYFLPALNIRLLCAVAYALVIQFYYGYGDTMMYYNAVQDMHRAVADDFSNLTEILTIEKLSLYDAVYPYFRYDGAGYTDLYMSNAHNYTVPKFALPFSLMFFKSYLCITFCLTFYAFAGCWRIFKMFYEMYPHLKKKLAIGVLFLPSILFWGSSFLKDSICIGSLGFMLYAAYSIILKKKKIVISALIIIATSMLIYYIKPYILLSVMSAMIVWAILALKNNIKDKALRMAAGIFFSLIAAVAVFFALSWIASTEMAAQFSSDKILETVQSQQGFSTSVEGSNFAMTQVENSFTGLLLLFPAGIAATLFRPFLWEAGNPLMILSALEAMGFIILTIMCFRKVGIRKFFSYAFSDPVIIFCMIFSVFFAALVGISTNNFGALVRYKIPCLPFYLYMLFIIMDKSGKFSRNYIFSKNFF